jgi:hypothetical protein
VEALPHPLLSSTRVASRGVGLPDGLVEDYFVVPPRPKGISPAITIIQMVFDRFGAHHVEEIDPLICDDESCPREDGVKWEEAGQYAWYLAMHTKRCFRYDWEFSYQEADSVWTVIVSCDRTRPHPAVKPKALEPMPFGFEPSEWELNEPENDLKRLVEILRRLRLAEFQEQLEDECGTWMITALWNGPILQHPRGPLETDSVH